MTETKVTATDSQVEATVSRQTRLLPRTTTDPADRLVLEQSYIDHVLRITVQMSTVFHTYYLALEDLSYTMRRA